MRSILLSTAKKLGVYPFYREFVDFKSKIFFHYSKTSKVSKRNKIIKEYFLTNEITKLNIGCGDKILDGWLNTDLEPNIKGSMYLDACEKFPFKDETINFITCEQFIEHIELPSGIKFINECYRVLKKGGVLRIATPCLDRYIALFDNNLNEEQEKFIQEFKIFHKLDEISPEIILNYMFYHWGHQNLYTVSSIYDFINKSEFTDVSEVKMSCSTTDELNNIERHQLFYGDFLNDFSTMVFEFKK